MQILSGTEVSKFYRRQIKLEVSTFSKHYGYSPKLAVILVGDNEASQIYVKKKEMACQKVGISSHRYHIDKKDPVSKLDDLIDQLNADDKIHGILLQLPLPKPFDFRNALEKLRYIKDVDGLTFEAVGKLCYQQTKVKPCTPKGIMAILQYYGIEVASKTAVVIGRSQIVGNPMSQMLMQANATVTLCHSKTKDLPAHTKQADLVVAAAGQPEFLGKDDFKKGAVVIDVGIHRKKDGSICGDVRFEELKEHAFAATPVPGGVGPMTVTMLLQNTLELAKMQQESKDNA